MVESSAIDAAVLEGLASDADFSGCLESRSLRSDDVRTLQDNSSRCTVDAIGAFEDLVNQTCASLEDTYDCSASAASLHHLEKCDYFSREISEFNAEHVGQLCELRQRAQDEQQSRFGHGDYEFEPYRKEQAHIEELARRRDCLDSQLHETRARTARQLDETRIQSEHELRETQHQSDLESSEFERRMQERSEQHALRLRKIAADAEKDRLQIWQEREREQSKLHELRDLQVTWHEEVLRQTEAEKHEAARAAQFVEVKHLHADEMRFGIWAKEWRTRVERSCIRQGIAVDST